MKKNNTFKFITVMLVLAMLVSAIAIGVTADETTIPTSGYAAVGIVDAEAHKAEVLLGTGEQGTVYFSGNAPATGAVYSYTRDANNLYTFTAERGNNSNSDQLGDTGWNLFYTPNGWMWNGLGQIIFPNASPIFIRYGNDNWTLSSLGKFVETNGAGWIFGYTLDEVQTDAANNYWAVGAIVLGGYNNGTIDTTGFDTCFPSITATNSLATFTTSLHANVNTDAIILETGYAAIGAVDAANTKAEILKGTGEQGWVLFSGNAPVAGGVYRYSRNVSNVYSFELPVANHGNSSTIDASAAAWPTWMNGEYGGYMWDGAYNHYWPSASTPFFVHTAANTWTLADVTCLVSNTNTYRMTYQLDVTVRDAANHYYNTAAVVFGGLNADGTVDTTGIDALNLPSNSHDLSALTNPLHDYGTEPEAPKAPLTDGMKVVIYNPAHKKALSSKPASSGSFYQLGVNVTLTDGTLTGFSDTEIWTVIANDDGTFSFEQGGKKIGMQSSYSSMSLGAVNDKWEIIDLGDGLFLIKNAKRGNYIEWYASKNNWSTYTSSSAATDPLFQLSFFEVIESTEPDPTDPPATEPAPTDPPATEPAPTDPPATEPIPEGANKVTTVIKDYAEANGWADSQLYDTLAMDSVITVTNFGTATNSYGRNTGKYYVNGYNWRIYQAENPTVTITANGATILTVKITYASQNDGTLTLNGENIASDTVVEVNAASVTFGVGNTGTKTNGQARITAIEVVYATAGGDAPVDPTDPPTTEPAPTEPEATEPAPTEPDVAPETGDSISAFIALMAVSAIAVGVVVSKKKEN